MRKYAYIHDTVHTISLSIALILSRAFWTFSFLPVMAIMSLSLFSLGSSIFVSVSSRILRRVAPPLPITLPWNFLKTRTSSRWLEAACVCVCCVLKFQQVQLAKQLPNGRHTNVLQIGNNTRTYQFTTQFLEIDSTFIHIFLWSSQCDNVLFLTGLRKCNLKRERVRD